MSNNQIISDYYLVVRLGVEDDNECSKAFWLEDQLEKADAEAYGDYICLRDRDRKPVWTWAHMTFSAKPDFYACIIERRSKPNLKRQFFCYDLIYLSPHIKNRTVMPQKKLEIDDLLTYYCKNICVIISEDQKKARLENRKRKK